MSDSVREQISKIFQDILGLNNQSINENTSVGDVANWDSLNHVLLISEIEKFYEIQFDLNEVMELESFGDICSAVEKKIA